MAKSKSPSRRSGPAIILEVAYQTAIDNIEKSPVRGAGLTEDVEYVCRCSNLAGTRFLMACLIAKLSNPAIDIRKPYTEIGGKGIYSGRHYDETYVGPFTLKNDLPVNPTTGFLTPAFRTNRETIKPGVELVGRPRKLYETIIKLVTAVYAGKVDPEFLLVETIRWLVIIKDEREHRLESLFASLKASQSDSGLPAESIVNLGSATSRAAKIIALASIGCGGGIPGGSELSGRKISAFAWAHCGGQSDRSVGRYTDRAQKRRRCRTDPDSAVNPALKEAFLSLRLATETVMAQSEE